MAYYSGLPALAFVLFAGVMPLLAACTQSDTSPQPVRPTVASRTVRLVAEPALGERALASASDLLASSGASVEAIADPAAADVVVTGTRPGPDVPSFVTRYWVPVVALPRPARELGMAELGDALAGRSTDSPAVTGEAFPLKILLPAEERPPLNQWWPEMSAQGEMLPIDDIPEALEADPGALALLPLGAVDARVRSLAVDGTNVVRGTGDVAVYPLVERRWVVVKELEDGEFTQIVREVASGLAEKLAAPPPDPILLRATGDIIPARCAYEKQRDYGDFRHAFLELGPWLAEADLTLGTLDAAISDAGVPFGCVETLSLLAPAASVDGLAFAGFDLMSVAANHVKDCGQAGCGDQAFFDTLANLRSQGIAAVGGGADLAEARQPAVITAKGVRFAFLAYDEIAPYYHAEHAIAGTAPLDEAFIREDVNAAAAQADVVVVLPHWGTEYTADPSPSQRALAAAAVESGADLVIGNHPHWVQAAEVIDGAFIAYALGNFVFDQDWSVPTQQGAVLDVIFHGTQLKAIEYYAIRIVDQHQPVFAGADEAREILDRIWTASATLD